ncbi:MAG: hypothetical protein FWH40_06585 [Coriobacteriia bacterium]|nr:hypothetical protein [Coriobacteriia bacterium]
MLAVEEELVLADEKIQAYPEVPGLGYVSAKGLLDSIARQSQGLTNYAALVNDRLLEEINVPFMSDLDLIIAELQGIDCAELRVNEALVEVTGIDYEGYFSNYSLNADFAEALQLRYAKYVIDRAIRERLALLDNPEDIDELLSLEGDMVAKLAAILAAGGVTIEKSEVIDLLTSYLIKQVRLYVFENKRIHNYVVQQVMLQTGGLMDVPIKYGGRKADGSTYGFMDIYNGSIEIDRVLVNGELKIIFQGSFWEIKSEGERMAGRVQSERYQRAGRRIGNMINEKFINGVTPGMNIEPFSIELGEYYIEVWSDDMVPDEFGVPQYTGVVLYRYFKQDDDGRKSPITEPSLKPATQPSPSTNLLVPLPENSRDRLDQGTYGSPVPGELSLGEKIGNGLVVVAAFTLIGIAVIACPEVTVPAIASYMLFEGSTSGDSQMREILGMGFEPIEY